MDGIRLANNLGEQLPWTLPTEANYESVTSVAQFAVQIVVEPVPKNYRQQLERRRGARA